MPLPRRLSSRWAFESRTQEWREVGLGAEIDERQAQRARGGIVVVLALIVAVLVVFAHQSELFPGLRDPVRIATVAAPCRRLARAKVPSLRTWTGAVFTSQT